MPATATQAEDQWSGIDRVRLAVKKALRSVMSGKFRALALEFLHGNAITSA